MRFTLCLRYFVAPLWFVVAPHWCNKRVVHNNAAKKAIPFSRRLHNMSTILRLNWRAISIISSIISPKTPRLLTML